MATSSCRWAGEHLTTELSHHVAPEPPMKVGLVRVARIGGTCDRTRGERRRRRRPQICALLKTVPASKPTWTQDTDEVTVTLEVKKDVTAKSVELTVHPTRLDLAVDGESLLHGDLEKEIDVDGSYWYMDSARETEATKCLTVVLLKKVMGYESFAHVLEEDLVDTTVTHRVRGTAQSGQNRLNGVVVFEVFLSVEIGGEDAGVLIVGLFGRATPEAVANFLSLVEGRPAGGEQNQEKAVFKKVYAAKYATFGMSEPVETDDWASDVLQNEAKGLKHEGPGFLSFDPQSSVIEFAFTFQSLPDFDGKRTVFGQITHGLDLLARIEAQGDENSGDLTSSVVVSNCGEVSPSEIEAILESERKRRAYRDT